MSLIKVPRDHDADRERDGDYEPDPPDGRDLYVEMRVSYGREQPGAQDSLVQMSVLARPTASQVTSYSLQ